MRTTIFFSLLFKKVISPCTFFYNCASSFFFPFLVQLIHFFPLFFPPIFFSRDRGVQVNLCAPQFFSHYCLKRWFPLKLFFYSRASFFLIIIFTIQYCLKMCFPFLILTWIFICFFISEYPLQLMRID